LLADGSINLPDFRAPENTFQLITQVVGRAGRDGRTGKGIIQAYNPAHYAVQMAARQDYLEFVERELTDRKINKYPPFGRIARILIKGPNEEAAYLLSKDAASALRKSAPPMRILGPVPCAISKIQANFRFHILVKATSPKELEAILKNGLSDIKAKGKLRLDVDIDPVSLL
jgi:primosomal protein N' (replication factor Y)